MKATSLILLSCLLLVFSCKKESFITSPDARITVTADSLKYDTVFPTAGSITQVFKIINDNNQKLRISSVKLMGGSSSAYKMNVDGIATPEATNLEIEANDSLYVFVQVNVNPNAANLPFIIRDSIQINYNGNKRLVQLEAWGQNAHFLRNKEVTTNETWPNDLPYVILGYLYVRHNATLTIAKGSRIYVHATAPIVIDGTLQVNGLKDSIDRVYFRGDRMDEPYKNYPASWPGLFFTATSKDNMLNYAVIKNAYQSIAAEDPSSNANPKITLNECVIDNSYDAGIIASNSSITARNCLISNCGKNIALIKGGIYQFTHCTVATYSSNFINHKDPVLTVTNYDASNVTANLTAAFTNCIFWGENGTVENEVVVDKKGSNTFAVNFNAALWKVKTAPANISSTAVINDQNPQFDSINVPNNYYNFRLKNSSPAIKKGTNVGVTIDLDGNTRPVGQPDLGAFEKH
ncbi:MAG: choice-of-anchor Q domain-containing protein [Chitinophagaceae bacterium]